MWRERAGTLVPGLLFLLFCSVDSAAGVGDIPVTEVTKDLVCLCGDSGCPNLIVATCTCDDAHRITQDVQARLDAGKTKEQILAEFVSEQGERVLAAPPRRGWKNLTAWILPFATVLAGTVFAFGVLRRWVRKDRQNRVDSPAPVVSAKVDDIYRKKLAQQLKDFD